jgi:hypothetical protein
VTSAASGAAGMASDAGQGAAQGVTSAASGAAGTASDAGKGAVQQGGKMLSSAGQSLGFGR